MKRVLLLLLFGAVVVPALGQSKIATSIPKRSFTLPEAQDAQSLDAWAQWESDL
jgi:hypothetical protein